MKILKENRVIDRDTVFFFFGVFAFLYFLNAIFPMQSDDLVMKLSYERFVLKEMKGRPKVDERLHLPCRQGLS